jgi:hypothetical protein
MAAIDVGSGATTRTWIATTNYTIIDLANPCNDNGTIDSIEVYCHTNATGVKVGLFYGSGTSYTCRSYINIGNVTAGSKVTTACSLTAQSGDYIGFYTSSGNLYAALSGGTGSMWKSADQFGQGEQTYADGGAVILSLYATGTSTATTAPTVTTQPPSVIYGTSAVGNGTVVSNGGANLTERGICWKTTSPPTTADSTAHDHTNSTGTFVLAMAGLSAGATYHVRAYAINSEGTSYGEEIDITTPNLDVGSDAINRDGLWVVGYTLIDMANPSLVNGVINNVKLWYATPATGVKVGTYFGSGTDYTCRASASLGNVAADVLVEFTGLSIAVQEGDFIGVFANTGYIEVSATGGDGLYYKGGDQTGSGQQTYENASAETRAMSVFATGIQTISGDIWYGVGIGDYIYDMVSDGVNIYPAFYMEKYTQPNQITKGIIAQVDIATMATTAVTPYTTGVAYDMLNGLAYDGTYLYASKVMYNTEIVQITPATLIATELKYTQTNHYTSTPLIYNGGCLYYGNSNFVNINTFPWIDVARLRKIAVEDMSLTASSPTFNTQGLVGLAYDAGYLYTSYVTTNAFPGSTEWYQHIVKVNITDMSLVTDRIAFTYTNYATNGFRAAVVIGDYIYWTRHSWGNPGVGLPVYPAEVWKFAKADGLAYESKFISTLPNSEAIATDGTYLYVGMQQYIYKLDPTTMTFLGTITVTNGMSATCLIIGDYIYVGQETVPGIIERHALTEFSSPPVVVEEPIVNENGVTNIQPTSAVVTIAAIADGGHAITELGVCYSTAANPVADATSDQVTTTAALGSYSLTLTGLTPQTTYHTKAYMKLDTPETVYSSIEYDFTTSSNPEPPVDPPPVYPTIAQASAKLNSASRRRFMTTSI